MTYEPLRFDRGVFGRFNRLRIGEVNGLDAAGLFVGLFFLIEGASLGQLQAKWSLLSAILDRLARLVPIDTPGRVVTGHYLNLGNLMEEACARGFIPIVEKLIKLGSDVAAKHEPCGRSTLHFASEPELIRLLARLGLEIDARDLYGLTPLHQRALDSTYASPAGGLVWPGMLELISRGADVNARTEWQESPLHVACGSRTNGVIRSDVVLGLVRAGAEVNATDRLGRTPADYLPRRLAELYRTGREIDPHQLQESKKPRARHDVRRAALLHLKAALSERAEGRMPIG